ncbi:MAG TPA: peptidoglycan-binding domain-containing protein [Chthoniobacterales bacterium]|nr:peptidoglycan-binding domain-containing protein [Chthoniobacterales bacterium]
MGKFRTSLLSIVFQLFLTAAIFAHDDVRKVQEELRKRHLFFGSINGQTTPALTAAISRYQAKKGFARTGLIDSQTLESLGLVRPVPRIDGTPFVVENNESARGPNGERVPLSPASDRIADERPIEVDRAMIAHDQSALPVAAPAPKPIASTQVSRKRSSAVRVRRVPARKETNPFAMAYRTIEKFFASDSEPKKKRSAAKRL